MNNAHTLLRSLITYALVVPLALMFGYLLTNPLDVSTFSFGGLLIVLLALPILLRWHYWLLLLGWNLAAYLFFMKGDPPAWLLMTAVSLTIAVTQRCLNPDHRFIRAPWVTGSLMFMVLVILITAKMTGGFGLRTLGSDVYGGKKYIYALGAIAGYFALTTTRIPRERAGLAVALFFLGALTAALSDFYSITPGPLRYIYLLFPPDVYATTSVVGTPDAVERLAGVATAAAAIISFMQARYGIRGIFLATRPWRLICFAGALVLATLGGFRSLILIIVAVFAIQFFMEGLHRSKLLPIFALIGILTMVCIFPFTDKLPDSMQRAIAFLPVKISSVARVNAQASMDWRYAMWAALIPQIPEYLLLGKGYAFSVNDFQFMGMTAFHSVDPGQQGLALANDYHNGWISVLIIFGVWGMIAFLWFASAGLYVLYCNFRYGDPALKTVNAFLFASFIVKFVLVMTISGMGLHQDMYYFVGWLGLSLALNHGICRRPKEAVAAAPEPVQRRMLPVLPALQH